LFPVFWNEIRDTNQLVSIKAMTLAEIRTICVSFPGVTEDIKWGNHLCFNIGGKMFLVTSPDSVPVTASIKVSDEEFEVLTNREGIIPAPYMARNKWVYVDSINRLSKKEWERYLLEAYTIIFAKLSGRMRAAIEGGSKAHSTKKKKVKPKAKGGVKKRKQQNK
jgi:predicted DNA-binding protein (MmcQ/YjbR family)